MQIDRLVRAPISSLFSEKPAERIIHNKCGAFSPINQALGNIPDWISMMSTLPTLECANSGISKDVSQMTAPEIVLYYENCTVGHLLEAFDKYCSELANVLIDAFNLANSEILKFVSNVTVAKFRSLVEHADENLEDFNCQYVGTSLKEGPIAGACTVVMPAVVALGLCGIFLFLFGGVTAFGVWKIYHYYHDLAVIGEIFDKADHNTLNVATATVDAEKSSTPY